MNAIGIQVKGLEKIQTKFNRLSEKGVKRAGAKAIRKGIQPAVRLARNKAPVRTGKMKRNIYKFKLRKPIADLGYGVGVRTIGKADNPKNAFYWKFVEHGTVKMRARPFLRPAFRGAANEMSKKTQTELIPEIIREYNNGG